MMGEHLASRPYQANMKIKNMNLIRHLINDEMNTVAFWECELRNSLDTEKLKKLEKQNREFYSNIRKKRTGTEQLNS